MENLGVGVGEAFLGEERQYCGCQGEGKASCREVMKRGCVSLEMQRTLGE